MLPPLPVTRALPFRIATVHLVDIRELKATLNSGRVGIGTARGQGRVPVRGIKTTVISVLALGLLAGSAVGVAAQDGAPADPMARAFFEVEYIAGDDFEFVDGTYEEVGPGLERFDGEIVRGQLVEAEDPRASSEPRKRRLDD